ncbi:MAG: hypothetical protein Q9188_003381 [Gyalolechia gomerana]
MAVSIMPFLNPLPPPSRSSLCLFAKSFSSTSPYLRGPRGHSDHLDHLKHFNKCSQLASKSTLNRKPTIASKPITTDPPPVPDITEPLLYHVYRTPSQQLPVYHLAKRGGSLLQTRLRKVDGDIMKLKSELQQALGLKQDEISVNQLTRHIIIKGWRRQEVNQFLQARNF